MKKIILFFAFLACVPAAKADMAIVATVNDEAITSTDLDGRVRLAMLGSGIKPDAETLTRLREQVLRSLIDERLQAQEAKRLGVTVDDKQVDDEVGRLAQKNGQTVQTLPLFFARNGVPISALRDQLRSNIAWSMVVQRKLRSQVNITDADIDAEAARAASAAGQPEYLSAEIFLPVQNDQQDSAVKQAALRLINEMSRGVRFSAVARQFSQSPSAARGGDLGWIRSGQLEPELDAALRQLAPGTLTPPIRTASGYYILMLREQRMASAAPISAQQVQGPMTLNLRQVLLPLAKEADAAALATGTQQLQELRRQVKSCADMEQAATRLGDARKGNIGAISSKDIPAALQPVLSGLADLQPSEPLRNDRGLLFLMICDRKASAELSDSARDEIARRLGAEKLELLARRYLRDLRQDAFIDIRR